MAQVIGLQETKPFCWVVNDLDVRCKLPVQIIPGCYLNRASTTQVDAIIHFLDERGERMFAMHEFERKPAGQTRTRMDREHWRYHVIEPDASSTISISGYDGAIEEASRLTALELHCPVFSMGRGLGYKFQSGFDPFSALRSIGDDAHGVLTEELVKEMQQVHALILAARPKHRYIDNALGMFRLAAIMPVGYPLTVLGLFSVIESILTHDPHGEYDSLGHQIRTKIPLLDERMSRRIDYAEFGNASVESVWKKVYQCRSRIAHGGEVHFTGDLKVLVGLATITKFLKNVTKALLRQALIEPDLVRNLRNC